MITTVVFDLDDTLYDEIDYCRSGFDAVADVICHRFAHEYCPEVVFDTLWTVFSTDHRHQVFNLTLEKLAIPHTAQTIRDLVRIYRNHQPNIRLSTESRECLKALSRKYTLGVLTDGFLPAQRLKVRALKIEKYFSAIVYTEQLGRSAWKPSPMGFNRLSERLEAHPEQMVYIADNPAKDFIAPNRLGWHTIRIKRPSRLHLNEPISEKDDARYHVEHLRQIPSQLDRITQSSPA